VDDRCREDLLEVDGRPVPVRVVGTSEDAVARQPLDIELCRAEGLDLTAGESVLTAAPGNETGIDLDTIELASEAGGEPGDGHTPNEPGPPVEVDDEGFVHADVTVAEPAEPFWLVLGQSFNPGWTATAGGEDLGAPTLVNGYANAWLVDADAEGGDVAVALEWTPQRAVWGAMALSGLGVLVCLVLLVLDPRRRRAVRAEQDEAAHDPGLRPRWSAPWALGSTAAGTRTTVIAGLAALALTTAFSGPVWGLLAGVGAVAALRWRWGLPLVRLGAVLGLAGAGAYITLSQLIRRYPPDFDWPNRFEATNWPALLAVALLVIATLVDDRADRMVASADSADATDDERAVPSGS
jgi:arabinofuranan 3-O-arabinosyltransferase